MANLGAHHVPTTQLARPRPSRMALIPAGVDDDVPIHVPRPPLVPRVETPPPPAVSLSEHRTALNRWTRWFVVGVAVGALAVLAVGFDLQTVRSWGAHALRSMKSSSGVEPGGERSFAATGKVEHATCDPDNVTDDTCAMLVAPFVVEPPRHVSFSDLPRPPPPRPAPRPAPPAPSEAPAPPENAGEVEALPAPPSAVAVTKAAAGSPPGPDGPRP